MVQTAPQHQQQQQQQQQQQDEKADHQHKAVPVSADAAARLARLRSLYGDASALAMKTQSGTYGNKGGTFKSGFASESDVLRIGGGARR